MTDPTERALIARIAAATRWANEPDRTAALQPARDAFRAKFEKQADPDGTMDPAERARRAESLRTAHYARIQLKSAQARRLRRQAAELEAEAARMDGAA